MAQVLRIIDLVQNSEIADLFLVTVTFRLAFKAPASIDLVYIYLKVYNRN